MSQEVDYYRIYVDQLKDGKVEKFDRYFPADVMEVEESELRFAKDIHVKGEAYLTEESLILHLDFDAVGTIPCSICNDPVEAPISVKGLYHVVSMDDIRGHIYDMREVVRENVLLNTPSFTECNGGNCSERASLGKYLKSQDSLNQEPEEGQQPFKDLQSF